MGFRDIMLGGRADYTYMPGVSGLMGEVRGLNFDNPGKAAKSSKKLLAALDSGRDVSDIGAFAPIQQDEAADLQDIDFDYMTGANALMGSAGGDNLNQINRMRDLAKERRREDTGRQMSAMIPALRGQAMDVMESANARKQSNILAKYGLLGQLNQQVFDRRRQGGGLLGSLVQGAAGALGSFLGRPPGVGAPAPA